MARDAQIQLTALCAVASFLWISSNFERHSLVEWPRLSSVLVFLISGALTWLASYVSEWLPGADGRFDESSSAHKTNYELTIPGRPRRYFVPLLVFCIFVRLEVFHQVTAQLQCSTPGVQSFLCTLLVFYEAFYCRKVNRPPAHEVDPWDTLTDDIVRWLSEARVTALFFAIVFSYGTLMAVGQEPRSTFFCSSLSDSRVSTLALQLAGLFLDGLIAVLLWRVLAWTKTTKLRLKTLGVVQALSGVFIKVFQVLASPFITSFGEGYPTSFSSLGSLYFFDIFIDSFAFAVLIASLSILVCETNIATPASIVTFVSGLVTSVHNIRRIGSWQIQSKLAAIAPLYLLCLGFGVYLYTTHIRSVFFIRRVVLVLLLVVFFTGMVIYGLIKPDTFKDHPLDKFIYDVRVESDRWLRHAKTSDSLRVAVDVYQERHYGRDPPPNFDQWYEFAKARNSVIIDHFEQMESDIVPFWGLKPEAIRQACNDRVPNEPHIAVVTVENKQVSHNYEAEDEHRKVLNELVTMIQGFVEHLSDMKLPINLSDQPRVLTPWSDLSRYTKAATGKKFKRLSSRTADGESDGEARATGQAPEAERASRGQDPENKDEAANNDRSAAPEALAGSPMVAPQPAAFSAASTEAFREMESSVCPAGSPGRSGFHWNVRDFCTSCVYWHEDGQFMWNWPQSKSLCDQNDLLRLHAWHLAAPKIAPIRELVPIFGRSKADGFNDILIPLVPLVDEGPDQDRDFRQLKDELYWRGRIGDRPISGEALRGSHKHRLVHLINNATASDEEVTMMLAAPAQPGWFGYEPVHAGEANAVLPFNVGISEYACGDGPGCAAARAELGQRPAGSGGAEGGGKEGEEGGEPLDRRYVLLTDEDSGPPTQLLRTVRSAGSVPFLASVFGEWYSERLLPWLHFVPVDLRFHALHSTLAYFVGLKGRGRVNGREVEWESRWENGEWIATQGKKWAEKALRREDMEVYLFRLLLEWGRVVRDDRDSVGFHMDKP